MIFAYSVTAVAPVLVVVLVLTRYARIGFGRVAVSMLGVLLFGIYHHYILASPGHVAHLPASGSVPAFRRGALPV